MNSFHFSLVILTLQWTLASSYGQEGCDDEHPQYYISKEGKDSDECYQKATHLTHPCASLSYLVEYRMTCSNVTIIILDEEIRLNGVLQLESNIMNFSIIGNSSSEKHMPVTIDCAPNSGIHFSQSRQILLKNLRFIGCYFNVSDYVSDSNELSAILLQNTYDTSILQCIFESKFGSAVLLDDTQGVTTINGSIFIGNQTALRTATNTRSGGIVIRFFRQLVNSKILISNATFNFCRNGFPDKYQGGAGGAIQITLNTIQQSISIEIEDCHFNENYARAGGAVAVLFLSHNSNNSISIARSHFNSNVADYQGGALVFASDKQVNHNINTYVTATSVMEIFITSCNFINNSAVFGGGLGGYVNPCGFCNNSMKVSLNSTIWMNNHANTSGFAFGMSGVNNWNNDFRMIKIVVSVSGISIFSRNRNERNEGTGAVSVECAELTFLEGITTFYENEGSALVGLSLAKIVFQAHVEFISNTGVQGGAIYIPSNSLLFLDNYSTLLFENNTAYIMGGAIYSGLITGGPHCVIMSWNSLSTPNVTFRNNKVGGNDQSIYIADAEACINWHHILRNTFQYFPNISSQLMYHIENVALDVVPLSGNKAVSLGEHFHLNPIMMWDVYNTTSFGTAYIVENSDNDPDLKLIGPNTLSIDNYTHEILFYIKGDKIQSNVSKHFSFKIFFPKGSTYRDGCTEKNISLVPCYLGYTHRDGVCKCTNYSDNIKCHSATKTFCVEVYYWYSSKVHKAYPCPTKNCNYTSGKCPKHKCHNSSGFCEIEDSKDVCQEGREDVLCSLCSEDYSFSFQANECVKSECNSVHTSLLILALVGYWVVFSVAILVGLSRNLSVGSGFMYGVVYYFSVVTVYVSNSQHHYDSWLEILINICIAVTQLDPLLLGNIKWCFVQSWRNPLSHQLLRYATPFFVLVMILSVIFISRHCRLPQRISFAENSPIHAICMLVLFSYTSLSCTSFKLLIPTFVEDEWKVKYAPSFRYFHGRDHIPYALIALIVELLVSLPICFFFLFAPKISSQVNLVKYKLKPIVDEFQACFHPQCRWFAGFYFLARQVVYLVDGLFTYQFPERNAILIAVNAGILLVHTNFQPYSNKWLNRLDTIFLLDILLLSLGLYSQSYTLGSLYNVEVYFHNEILPYFLVLLPVCYLFSILVLMFINKKWALFKLLPCCTKLKARMSKNTESATHHVSTEALLRLDYSSEEDDKLREELLDDDPIGSGQYRVNYGTIASNRITTSSVRLHKPPRTM